MNSGVVAGQDREALRIARTLFVRHGLNISRAEVHVSHGVCYVRGLIEPDAGSNVTDVNAEVQRVAHFIRQKPGIRNVVLELSAA